MIDALAVEAAYLSSVFGVGPLFTLWDKVGRASGKKSTPAARRLVQLSGVRFGVVDVSPSRSLVPSRERPLAATVILATMGECV